MKNSVYLIVLMLLLGCSEMENKNNDDKNPLQGDWCFLDKYGNYNEAFFGDSTYRIYNKYVGAADWFKYDVRNDSLYSSVDRRRKGLSRIAKLIWEKDDEVIFMTEFTTDTLYKIKAERSLLSNCEPGEDTTFVRHFFDRYEQFLIAKGIITEEESVDFRKNQKVPKDIK